MSHNSQPHVEVHDRPAAVATADRPVPTRTGRAVGWSFFAVTGRQASQMVFALVLAKWLGPDEFGITSAASVYVTLTTLLLDQGLASALIQRPQLHDDAPGAVATVNIAFGVLLAGVTWVVAPQVADFFDSQEMIGLVRVLGLGLLLKAIAINPRAMLMRNLRFRTIAIADVVGGVAGAIAGVVAAVSGAGAWALAWQVCVTDAVIALVFVATRQGGRPNLRFSHFVAMLPFSLSIFGASALAFLARNSDNILVGRYLGVAQLSLYALGYRILSVPVQFVGQTVNRVAFPTMSKMSAEGRPLGPAVVRWTEVLAIVAVPPMVFVAVSAHELVEVVLGDEWRGAITVLTILALAGARETVLQVTQSLMRALGRGRLIFRYEIGATACQLCGIIVGLHWGVEGVAVGFLVAGIVLTPVLLTIQQRLAGVTPAQQARAVLPTVHATAWAAAAYLAVKAAIGGGAAALLLGWVAFVAVGLVVLGVVHRGTWRRLVQPTLRRVAGVVR